MKMRKTIIGLLLALTTMPAWAQTNNQDEHLFTVAKNLEVFNAIYKDLDMMYVDTLDADETIGHAIAAMLHSLDPYTEYYPEDKQSDLKMMLSGKYAGIGALIRQNMYIDRVVIDEPYENMPAAEAGVRKGDIILSIDDSTMVGKSVSYVSEHLRGDAGTTFILKVIRPDGKERGGNDERVAKVSGKEMKFKITRRSIQLPAISYYGLQQDSIGYLGLTQFTEECSKDVRRAFLEMKKQGMRKFVLDLRNNGGGSLQEAINILNMFVPKDLLLVKTVGKMQRVNRDYKTTVEPIDTVMPIVVLVNGSSASASEITSGSLQDLDRAVVMGTRTFGKGLVQLPNLPLPYNGNLKLTTGKYFIPSGRCIQEINYKKRREKGELKGQREASLENDSIVFYTAHGRKVKAGGGIMPDVEVKPDSLPNIAFYLASSGRDSTEAMFRWELDYLRKHPTIAQARDFEISDADYESFKQFVIASGFKYDRESKKQLDELVKLAKFEGYYDDAKSEFEALETKLNHNLEKDLDYNKEILKQLLANDIVAHYYYQRGAVENSLRYDKQWQEAVKLLNDDTRYKGILNNALSEH